VARIFLSEAEAEAWGLKKKRTFNYRKMQEKVITRVLAGLILVFAGAVLTWKGPAVFHFITTL
jgi:hypothetical protein